MNQKLRWKVDFEGVKMSLNLRTVKGLMRKFWTSKVDKY